MSTMTFSLSTDDEGFISRECPTCNRRFKIKGEQTSAEKQSHCAYCNHIGEGCWFTTEQVEYAQAVAYEQLVQPKLDDLAKSMRGMSSGLLKFEMKTEKKPTPEKPIESNLPMPQFSFPCCNETIKYDDAATLALHCVVCGVSHTTR